MRWVMIVLLFAHGKLSTQTPVDRALQDLTQVIVHDVFSAPAASRIYAYTCIAGFEASRFGDQQYATLQAGLLDAPQLMKPKKWRKMDAALAGAWAMYLTGRNFVYSEGMLMAFCNANIGNNDTTSREYLYGKYVAEQVIQWSLGDGYAQTRSMERFTPTGTPGSWEPTPPDFAPGLEPYWGLLRRFVKGTDTLHPLPPMSTFSTDTNSIWHSYSMQVMEKVRQLSDEERLIVMFWDDNPFAIVQHGHFQYAQKKVSPTGHWLDITRTALDSVHADPVKRAHAYALVSVAMADAMYEAWEAKYQYRVLRPETYINKYLDPNWRPLIVSPPFPEYPSGHSCVSAAAATILTQLFGADFDFTDASETQYDLPARQFASFQQAAEEAGMSRFYGGIHFTKGVYAGTILGTTVATHELKLLK